MFQLTRRHMLAGLAGTAAMAGIEGSFGTAAHAQAPPYIVNTYGGRWEKFWRAQLLPKFEPMLGRPVKLDIGLGNGWVSTFRTAGKEKSPFDVLMANERYAAILRAEGLLAPMPAAKIANLADVYPIARYKDDVAVTGIVSPIGIAYRTDLIKAPPKTWRELWDAKYNGQLGFYSVNNSLAVMFLMLAGKLYGKDEFDLDTGFRKLAELKPFPQVDFSGAMAPLLTQGQVGIAPIDFAEAVALQQKGVPIGIVVPEDGVLMFDQSFNVAANAADKEACGKYIDFMLSPEVQTLLAKEFFTAPVNRKVKVPDELRPAIPVSGDDISKIVTFDWQFVARNRQAMMDRWSKEI
jgi:putative spermidine/putrescine transport system substrate-binding protein